MDIAWNGQIWSSRGVGDGILGPLREALVGRLYAVPKAYEDVILAPREYKRHYHNQIDALGAGDSQAILAGEIKSEATEATLRMFFVEQGGDSDHIERLIVSAKEECI
jgi:hypothetical protein